jgi:hypothetical protein
MKVWIFRDEIGNCFDVCSEYTDAIGPGFVEAELDEGFVKDFAKAELHYGYFQVLLEKLWETGKAKETADGKETV